MSVKRPKSKTGRPVKVPGEKGTKEKIFDAAVDLFAEKGYGGVSIRDIGKAVGVTEGAVYKHYASKEEILDSIFSYVEGHIYPKAPEAGIDIMIDTLSLAEILNMMPVSMAADPRLTKITRIMIIEMYHNEKIRDYVRKELFERPAVETGMLFRKLREKGKIRPCDPDAMATLFISYLIYWYFEVFIFSYGQPLELDRSLDTAQKMIRSYSDMLKPEGGVEQ